LKKNLNLELTTYLYLTIEKIISCTFLNKELITLYYWDIGKSIVEKQEAFGWEKSVVKKRLVKNGNIFLRILKSDS
jgi:hypothetical protein